MFDVLILDDDVLTCHALSEVLSDEGFNVVEAHTSSDAMALLSDDGGARVLVADRHLAADRRKGTDGFEAAAEALKLYPHLKVVYISSDVASPTYQSPSARERVLPKPFIPIELLELVQDFLREG